MNDWTDPSRIALDGSSLTLRDIVRLARPEETRPPVAAVLDPAAARAAEASVELRDRLMAERRPIYGVTTGFGDSVTNQISPERAAQLQHNLIRYHLNGVGPNAPADVVRATLLIRANCLALGNSGIRPLVVDRLLAHLNADILPLVPERGSLGASGDLVPLCYVAATLLGDGDAQVGKHVLPVAEAQREAGIEPVALEAKEGLALINGTSFTTAFAVLAAHDAAGIATAAEIVTAFVSEALLGNASHFAEFLHRAKPHPGQVASAAHLRRLLAGSQLSTTYEEILAEAGSLEGRDFRELEVRIQDHYSVRCAPQVIGVLRDTLSWVEPWLTTEVNASTDNPLFSVEEERPHHGGNFYAGHVGQAMDSLKTATANIADLLDRQLALIIDPKFSGGLPANLVPLELHAEAGLHHGFKGMQIAASAVTAEALKTALPATVFSRSTEAHNQDKVSMATTAARDARTVNELTGQVAAIALLAAAQALDLRGLDRAAPRTRAVHALIRAHAPYADRDRRMDQDIAAVARLISDGSLARAAGAADEREPHAAAS
ncbi:aromatic amino acid lyase [Streptomyces sp. MBT56]|uniref:HAL/PAL/TAL family ammonia-lyase n=1 Tax=unclassified Streptomyces TaxID=2593676 RepID=UPI00190BE3D4|nr:MULTISPECIES: aromatic amino acid ammonia-lyase [unclassified Streptomyces]MBK3558084.1 aromatic amino acid lyase [Streptomyces sp. MBT56]MBK3602760.1 aromatic amino acid lyase [Streptomyces sp. MBT54]MBK3615396.1 aromatic amino acid lyase [Streptomyces sp. MBT98]MBK6043596.1 aromatic amino acid lyase [Streptomyces sp. MBT55]